MPIYYRVLYSQAHVSEWYSGKWTSYHHANSRDWVSAWQNQKREPEDFPLAASDGVYTPEARAHFLARAPKLGIGIWPEEDLRAASQLAGVCAFDDPAAAVAWNSVATIPALFVEFEGEYLCAAPDDPAAVVARVIRPIGELLNEQQFRAKHGVLSGQDDR